MTTLIAIFITSLFFSLVLTPPVTRLNRRLGLMDEPSERRTHAGSIPRGGGIAIFISFFLPFLAATFFTTPMPDWLALDRRMLGLLAGALAAFGMGLWDDAKGVRPGVKFLVQTAIGCMSFAWGLRIASLYVPLIGGVDLGWLALPATVLWFLLVMNGINLIDGLDGLAAGVTLFAALVLLVMCVLTQRYLEAMGFAALAGSCLGFLRYNFNPASVFMGDCGSYFLGYMLAALSLAGSIKSQAAAALLIPLVALGVPLMEVVWAAVRRFVQGRSIFQPDTGHFHHRLLRMGFTHRRAVLALYGVSVCMGLLAIVMVHSRDERAALILLLLGLGIFFGLRKLGYLEYLALDKFYGWIRDVTDEMGISRERRSFLNIQMEISRAETAEDAWQGICEALERLKFDAAELAPKGGCGGTGEAFKEKCTWSRPGVGDPGTLPEESLLKLTLPLFDEKNVNLGTLRLVKDVAGDPVSHYTLRRVEHLRRTITRTMQRLSEN